MFLYRIAPKEYLKNFDGINGSYEHGARWNLPGDRVIYFGTTPAVVMLEAGNYLPSPRLIPDSFRLAQYKIASRYVDKHNPRDLPDDWNMFPHPASTQRVGSAWLRAKRNLVLLVPSSAVPGGLEDIAIFNPLHAQARALKFVRSFERIYDERLFGG